MSIAIDTLGDAGAVAARGAAVIAEAARDAVAARGRFALALSGGSSPLAMFRRLTGEDLPWERVHLFQVDERVVPPGDPARNWTQLRAALLDHVALPAAQRHPMPVEAADLAAAARAYAGALARVCGAPPVLDLVHLGLGADGHTASLVPGDPVLAVTDREVALTGPYRGHRRMTLTFPALDRARRVLWIVTGADKRDALARLRRGDRGIPAARVAARAQLVLTAA